MLLISIRNKNPDDSVRITFYRFNKVTNMYVFGTVCWDLGNFKAAFSTFITIHELLVNTNKSVYLVASFRNNAEVFYLTFKSPKLRPDEFIIQSSRWGLVYTKQVLEKCQS